MTVGSPILGNHHMANDKAEKNDQDMARCFFHRNLRQTVCDIYLIHRGRNNICIYIYVSLYIIYNICYWILLTRKLAVHSEHHKIPSATPSCDKTLLLQQKKVIFGNPNTLYPHGRSMWFPSKVLSITVWLHPNPEFTIYLLVI